VITEKSFMPVAVDVKGRVILIVGGGRVALHKLKTIQKYADTVTIVAPEIIDELVFSGAVIHKKLFEHSDLEGVFIVYACTDDTEVNAFVARSAHACGILYNVCDNPSSSLFVSPAIYKDGDMSVAVSSNGKDVKRSMRWRSRVAEIFRKDPS
jgi:precorrin-2 dehydrogenase/sirohydrochlorin ferrochelatase